MEETGCKFNRVAPQTVINLSCSDMLSENKSVVCNSKNQQLYYPHKANFTDEENLDSHGELIIDSAVGFSVRNLSTQVSIVV